MNIQNVFHFSPAEEGATLLPGYVTCPYCGAQYLASSTGPIYCFNCGDKEPLTLKAPIPIGGSETAPPVAAVA